MTSPGCCVPGRWRPGWNGCPLTIPAGFPLAGQVVLTADLLAAEGSMATFIAEQLASLRASPLGRWLGPAPAEEPGLAISLGEVVRARGVVLFSLDRAAHGRAADTVASLVAQDVTEVYARLQRAAIGGDGLAWFGQCETVDPQALAGLVGAGAGLATVLSTTAAAAVGRLADQVSVLVLHRLEDHSLAGRLAWLTGKRLVPAALSPARPAPAAGGWPEPGDAPADAGGAVAAAGAAAARRRRRPRRPEPPGRPL